MRQRSNAKVLLERYELEAVGVREKGGKVDRELSPCMVMVTTSGEFQGDAATYSAGAPFSPEHSCPKAALGRRGHVSHILLTLPWSEPHHTLGCII